MKRREMGFTLIELLFVIAILGILAAIAIPKFSGVSAAANTAKVQADLRTIDAAVMMHYAVKRTALSAQIGAQLDDYLERVPNPPEGEGNLADGSKVIFSKSSYTISGTAAGSQHAQVATDQGDKTLEEFVK